MKDSIKLEISKQEADAILQIINVAVKASGVEGNIARNSIYFIDKINNAFTEPEKTFTEKVEEKVRENNLKELSEIIKP